MVNRVTPTGWWSDLKIHEYGHEANGQIQPRLLTSRDRYSLYFIEEGIVHFRKDAQVYELSNGDVFIMSADTAMSIQCDTELPCEYVWITFSCESRPEFLSQTIIYQPPVRQIFLAIREHIKNSKFDGRMLSLTYEMFWLLSQDAHTVIGSDRSYASYAKAYLDTNFMSQVKIQNVADQLHIDRRYLTGLFRKEYGMPPQVYLMSLRLDKARELLRLGYSVTESAGMAGFTDLPNFSRQYRSKFGISPGSERFLKPENSP